ncbi:MAG: glycosyltransferase, partial [Anaerolineales bacterium]|nr:glycosyltransferase [Anaerolineales bacterium]
WSRFEGDIAGIHARNQISRLKQAGITVDVFPFRGKKNPLAYWRARRRFQELDIAKYDVIHAHHGQAGIVALAQNQRPVVVTFHGSDLQGIRDQRGRVTPLGYVLRFASQWVASRADEIILVAEHLAKRIRNRPYHLIPAGIDLTRFRPMPMDESRAALGLAADKKLILFVGDPNRTEKRFWLAKKSAALQGAAEIIIANGVPPENMPLYMNACDILLVTSSTEGSPNAVKEALACNLPIVSTDAGDIRQRIQSVEGCILCEDDSAETIGAAIEQALKRNKRIRGRETVLEFDENALAEKVIMVYRKAVSK